MTNRFPWNKNTSEDIADQTDPLYETPQGAQIKADAARDAARDAAITTSATALSLHAATGTGAHPTATTTSAGFQSAADKVKLNGIADNANNYVHPATHPPSIIAQDSSNRFVTDGEKAAWNAKANTSAVQAVQTNLDTHASNTVIHVTQTDRDTWNSKAAGNHTHPNATTTTPGFESAEDKTKLDTSTNAATANTLMQRDAAGRAKVAAPSASTDIARKQEVDTVQSNLDAHTSNTVIHVTQADRDRWDAGGGGSGGPSFGKVNNINASVANDTLTIAQGTGITVSTDPATKTVTVTATGSSAPGPHAATHAPGGSDPIQLASTTQAGLVQLNDTTTSTSTTQAGTANAVKTAKDRADAAYTAATTAASTTVVGVTQLNDTITSTSTSQAATANAAKTAYDRGSTALTTAQTSASTTQAGRVQLNDTVTSTSTTQAATANAVKTANDNGTRAATTSQAGQVVLNDTTNSTSTTQAATPNAVKTTYDLASGKQDKIRQADNYQPASALPTAYPDGESFFKITGGLANGYPVDFGNVTVKRTGSSATMQVEEVVTTGDTTDATGRVYFRNKRDANSTWQPFVKVLTQTDLNNTVTSTSTTQAATASAVKTANDNGTRAGSTTQAGQLQMYDGIDSTSTTLAATANAVRLASLTGGSSGTTASITYYVDGTAGLDTNNGTTTGTAFKTISKAIYTLPKMLNHDCSIIIKGSQTYSENILVSGFYGPGELSIVGAFAAETFATLSGTINVSGNSCSNIYVRKFTVNQTFSVKACTYVQLDSITSTSTTTPGVEVTNGATCNISGCTISNKSIAIRALTSRIFSINNTGSGNTNGLVSVGAATIGKSGTQPAGTTAEVTGSGGVIRA